MLEQGRTNKLTVQVRNGDQANLGKNIESEKEMRIGKALLYLVDVGWTILYHDQCDQQMKTNHGDEDIPHSRHIA